MSSVPWLVCPCDEGSTVNIHPTNHDRYNTYGTHTDVASNLVTVDFATATDENKQYFFYTLRHTMAREWLHPSTLALCVVYRDATPLWYTIFHDTAVTFHPVGLRVAPTRWPWGVDEQPPRLSTYTRGIQTDCHLSIAKRHAPALECSPRDTHHGRTIREA